MIGPRIKVKALATVRAASPEALCEAVNPKLQEDGSWEIHGLPQYCADCKLWTQFLVQTSLVVPRELLEQAQANMPRILPVAGKLQS